jgi:hypothetical protein
MPVAMNCTPSLDIARKSLSPRVSMKATSLRSTTHVRPLALLWRLFQLALSSPTHGPTNRPCKIHRFSVGVSLMEILSTLPLTSAKRLRPPHAYGGAVLSVLCQSTGNPSWPAYGCLSHVDLGTTALKRNPVGPYGCREQPHCLVLPQVRAQRQAPHRPRIETPR